MSHTLTTAYLSSIIPPVSLIGVDGWLLRSGASGHRANWGLSIAIIKPVLLLAVLIVLLINNNYNRTDEPEGKRTTSVVSLILSIMLLLMCAISFCVQTHYVMNSS